MMVCFCLIMSPDAVRSSHQIVVDILVVGISEGLVRHPVTEYIVDVSNRLASCLVVVEGSNGCGCNGQGNANACLRLATEFSII